MSIEIANESGMAVDEPSIVAAARFALDRLGVGRLAGLGVTMDELDSARRPDAAEAGPTLLGDVVLCPAFARDQARQAGHSLIEELHRLTVHGVLHLLGYDHAEPAEEREMFTLQKRILADFGVARADAKRRAAPCRADGKLLGALGFDAS